MMIVTLILMAGTAYLTYLIYRPKIESWFFYAIVAIAIILIFWGDSFFPPTIENGQLIPSSKHIVLGISLILGHISGVLIRTWRRW